tara:strand:- start:581 stop:823 length:243 start_codon:yes stop_codon:yes gene_type:complete
MLKNIKKFSTPLQDVFHFNHILLKSVTIFWLGVDSKKNIIAPAIMVNFKNPIIASIRMILRELFVNKNEKRTYNNIITGK